MLLNLQKVFNDNKIIDKFLRTEFDFIIIGSGPAGVTLCNEILKKKQSNILIIEKGDLFKKRDEKIFYKFLPIKSNSRIFGVGGSSNAWSNISSSFEKFEMEQRWKKKNINLWPLSYEELQRLYNKIDTNYKFNYENLKKNKTNLPFELRKFYGSNEPTNFKNYILYDKINLLYNCEILTLDEVKKKSFIIFKHQNQLKKIFGKKIIICAGGIESTALVLRSLQKKQLNSIKNKKLVGSYFMDHPKFFLGYLKYPKIDLIKNFFIKKRKKLFYYTGVSLSKNIQRNKEILNSYVRFEYEGLYFNFKKKDLILSNIVKFLYHKIFNSKKFTPNIRIRAFSEMVPRTSNKILVSKKDQKIFVNYKMCSQSIKTLRYLSTYIYKYFSNYPEKELVNKITKKFLYNNIEDASHHMGGLIYSKDIRKSIVDKNLKIMGTNKIFVCSSAVFPTSGSVNPTMTICALAVRLANYLVK
jgi:choline dehydrogenase-like flavoprotein